jgi:hypothetical protein
MKQLERLVLLVVLFLSFGILESFHGGLSIGFVKSQGFKKFSPIRFVPEKASSQRKLSAGVLPPPIQNEIASHPSFITSFLRFVTGQKFRNQKLLDQLNSALQPPFQTFMKYKLISKTAAPRLEKIVPVISSTSIFAKLSTLCYQLLFSSRVAQFSFAILTLMQMVQIQTSKKSKMGNIIQNKNVLRILGLWVNLFMINFILLTLRDCFDGWVSEDKQFFIFKHLLFAQFMHLAYYFYKNRVNGVPFGIEELFGGLKPFKRKK